MEVPQNDRIQDAIAHHLATGKYTSAEDVVLAGLQRLDEDEAEHLATVADLQESLADEQAGRLKPLPAVAAVTLAARAARPAARSSAAKKACYRNCLPVVPVVAFAV